LARSYLGGVERGQRNIALLNIFRLAKALELPPSDLLGFSSARQKYPHPHAARLHAPFIGVPPQLAFVGSRQGIRST